MKYMRLEKLFKSHVKDQGGHTDMMSFNVVSTDYYAALLRRRGPHIASHSVCLSVCLFRPSRERK